MRSGAGSHVSGRSARPSGRFGVLAAITVLLAAGCWTVWREQAAKREEAAAKPAHVSVIGDFDAVWSWSGPSFAGGADGAKWTIRWDEAAAWSLEDARKLAGLLGIVLAEQSGGPLTGGGGGAVYTGRKTAGGMELTIWLQAAAGESASAADAVVLLQPPAGTKAALIHNYAGRVEEAAAEAGLSLNGSFAVRGKPAGRDAAARIADAAGAERRESYDDGHTRSVTYYSPKLKTGVTSAGKPVNLQIAESGAAGGGEAELIVGVPLITGDYTVQDS
ncbi:YwmB family TATA-box binding protein [Paenibacillus humicola]|uniref:YwmB family TATA-box binding protein n=1 Tax=Paenibacillus humicola TaxID=3110540 RepID=UPI00237C074F|nr:YwmB family TATA-box binding protein [Paenibacillus humicola]